MNRYRVMMVALAMLLVRGAAASGADDTVTIYRDTWGVPHIYGPNEAAVAYGHGYAQAEDRLEALLRNYLRVQGREAEAFGPKFLPTDYRARMWRHVEVTRKDWAAHSQVVRDMATAFIAGVRKFMADHPDKVPAWAPALDPVYPLALGRYIVWGWPEGQAAGDLLAGGIRPEPIDARSSNQWAVAASRSAVGAPILLIDPHLGFYGPLRFYESRLHGGALHTSGVSILGTPTHGLGHNRYIAWAMTTGGPDTADIYEETVNPDDPLQYRYDDKWRKMTVRTVEFKVKQADGSMVSIRKEIHETHHGPVVARSGDKAYAAKLSYYDSSQLAEEMYRMNTAQNLEAFRQALSLLQLMPQNVMYADVQGHIYYVRNGRVPIRPDGFNWRKPVPGNTSKSEWQGLHTLDDLIQVLDPPQGYMQNCNVSPDVMMVNSPMTSSRYRFYLFNSPPHALHQRAARVLDLLQRDDSVTVEEALAYATDVTCNGFHRWQEQLATAAASQALGREAREAFKRITEWDGRSAPDSVGATVFKYWRQAVERRIPKHAATLFVDYNEGRKPADFGTTLLAALEDAVVQLKKEYGRLDVPFGEIHRIGRGDHSWPVGGGSFKDLSMATPRALGRWQRNDKKQLVARSGQSAPQLVVLTKRIVSYSALPLGNSDDPTSPHYADQAEKLVSKGKLKPTWFHKEDMLKHVESKRELQLPAKW